MNNAWVHTLTPNPLIARDTTVETRNWTQGDMYMIGSSHMRYFYDAALQEMGFNITHSELKHENENVTLATGQKINFLSRQYLTSKRSPELAKHGIIQTLESLVSKPNSEFLIQFGSWDLHSIGLARTILTAIEDLSFIIGTEAYHTDTFTLITPPVYPYGSQTGT